MPLTDPDRDPAWWLGVLLTAVGIAGLLLWRLGPL